MNKPLSGLLVCRLIMSLAERLSSKFHICKCSFFGQSLSRGHYQPTYQPPEGVYLLNNPRDEVEGIIRQYSLSLREIIVLV